MLDKWCSFILYSPKTNQHRLTVFLEDYLLHSSGAWKTNQWGTSLPRALRDNGNVCEEEEITPSNRKSERNKGSTIPGNRSPALSITPTRSHSLKVLPPNMPTLGPGSQHSAVDFYITATMLQAACYLGKPRNKTITQVRRGQDWRDWLCKAVFGGSLHWGAESASWMVKW